eukprot:1016372_1
MLLSKYSYVSRHGLKCSHSSIICAPSHHIRSYSIDTPPEDLQKNVPALVDNIDMKNLALHTSGGRSSVSGVRATVFGASSALGRHIVNQLGRMGSQVILPYRGDGTEVKDHRLMGDLGQIVPLPYQIRDKRSVERVIQDSNVVINAISRRRESRNFSFHDTHVNATHMIARTAAELGVDRFIQLSTANASPDSASRQFATKWHGEQVAKAFYPEATIIRPGQMCGNFDWWFERFAWQWALPFRRPMIVGPRQRLQPCNYLDVARAVAVCVMDPLSTAGKTYEIHGNVCATKEQFYARMGEVLSGRRTDFKLYRAWNPYVLGAIMKPWYGLHKNIQFIGDFIRHYPHMQLNTHEDVMQCIPDMFHDTERFERDGIYQLKDLDIEAEDYFHWETRTLEPYYERWAPRMEDITCGRKDVGYGGPVPTTHYISWHSVAMYGHRRVKRGMFNRDWWGPDAAEYDYQFHDQQQKHVRYGSDIDGNSTLNQNVQI